MQTGLQPLSTALALWTDVQAVIGEIPLLVRDFTCYSGGGMLVFVNKEEPGGIHNQYSSVDDIEGDLGRVVPGYVKGASIWQAHEDEYDL